MGDGTLELADSALRRYLGEVRPEIERGLSLYLPTAPLQTESGFEAALHYALFPGGKRLRPVLTMLGSELVGGSGESVLAAATVVEYLHNSSLIFDDLPSMDNATERRGRAALHVRHGEGLAILVALALLNASYGLIVDSNRANPELAAKALREVVSCVGAQVCGQAYDIAECARPATPSQASEIDALRNLKTTALIRLALRLGVIVSGGGDHHLSVLSAFADLLGDAYQISDDIADFEEDEKSAGAERQRSVVLAEGTESARRRVSSLVDKAKDVIKSGFGDCSQVALLCGLADYLAERRP